MLILSILLCVWACSLVGCVCQSDVFWDEGRNGKLQMTPEDRLQYWEKVYADKRSKKGKDWYGPWKKFKRDIPGKHLNPREPVLVVGCGNSKLPADLKKDGFMNVTSMDYSKNAIELQREKYPDMTWVVGDARDMKFPDGTFEIVIEKALMDGEGSFGQHYQMFSEYSRVLKPQGRLILISLGKPEELNTETFLRNASYTWQVNWKLSYDGYYLYEMTKLGLWGWHKDRQLYWDSLYRDRKAFNKPDQEWYGPWSAFAGAVVGNPFEKGDKIMVVGCGTSDLSVELVNSGIRQVASLDYSKTAIHLRRKKHKFMNWIQSDVRRIVFRNESQDAIIDKALLDGEITLGHQYEMFSEYSRLLKHGGRFILISMHGPDMLNTEQFLANSSYSWDIHFKKGHLDYWVYTCFKFSKAGPKLPPGRFEL